MIESYPIFSMVILGIAIRPIIIILHQVGHAFMATIFAHQKIEIFLGSYGNKDASANITIRSWKIWFTSNPFLWQSGLCVPSFPITSVKFRYSYFLAGPILPVAVSAIIADAAIFFHFGDYWKFVSLVFFGVSVLDLIINLIPWPKEFAIYDNNPVFTDGYNLRLTTLQKKYPLEFFTAISQYSKQQYEDAARNFERAARRMPGNKEIDKNLKECYLRISSQYPIPASQ